MGQKTKCRSTGRETPAGFLREKAQYLNFEIDGIVASIMALDRCIRNQGEEQGSVYDNRGILVL